jgi:hypothetical protein
MILFGKLLLKNSNPNTNNYDPIFDIDFDEDEIWYDMDEIELG